ncbi:hypothetical protein ACM66B_001822 [Microbotryomycetes sp. NB124-2]
MLRKTTVELIFFGSCILAELYFSQKLIAIAHHVGAGGILDSTVLAGAFLGRAACTVCSVVLDRLASILEDKLSSAFALTIQTEILRAHCTLSDEQLAQPRTKHRLGLLRDLGQSGLYRKAFDPLGLFEVGQTGLSLILSAAMFKSTLTARNAPLLGLSLAFLVLEEVDRKLDHTDAVEHYDVSNDSFLRFQSMFKLGTSKSLRREVVTLGIQDHILASALGARDELRGVSTSMSPTATQRSTLRLTSLVLALARPITTTLFIWQAAMHNRRASLCSSSSGPQQAFAPIVTFAEMTIVDSAVWGLRVRWSSLRRGIGDIKDGLDKLAALYEGDEASISPDYQKRIANDGKRGLDVEFKNVSLRYPATDVPALEEVSFKARAGQLVVLVGHNGSGKTTLLSLLSKTLRASSGDILFNGQAIQSISAREMAGIVSVAFQSTPVLPMSIREYVSLPVREANDVALQVERALEASSADVVIDSLEDGQLSYAGGVVGGSTLSLDDWMLPRLVPRRLDPPSIEPLMSLTSSTGHDVPSSMHQSLHSEATTLVEAGNSSDKSSFSPPNPKRQTGTRYTSIPVFIDTSFESTIHIPSHSPEPCLLSGGQWQRIVLARALCAVQGDNRLLLLDEPAASLDPVAEEKLMAHVVGLRGQTTVFIATHRLSICTKADKVLVLGRGKILEQGTHAELLKQGGAYCNMWHAQAKAFVDVAAR